MSEAATKDSQPTKPLVVMPHRRRGFRWLFLWMLRGVVILLAIGLLVIIATAIVLKTDYPRRIVISELQKSLGLRVESATMEIDWTGHTVLRNVKISLPLAEQSFLEVPELDAVHTSLPMIVVLRNVELKAVTFRGPTVQVVQDISGRWNIADAIELITRAGGKSQADQGGKPSSLALPAVTVVDGTLKLVDRQHRTATITPLQLHGQPNGPLVWKFDAGVQDQLHVAGQVSPGGLWEHEVRFSVGQIDPWVASWIKTLPKIQTAGQWRGRVDGAAIDGRLMLDKLDVGTFSGQGVVNVSRDAGGTVTASPDNLLIQTHNDLAPEVRVRSGAIQLVGTTISTNALTVGINGGEAKLDSHYSWADDSASVDAIWHDVALPQSLRQQGTLKATLSMPWPGAPRIEAHVDTVGQAPAGAWQGTFDLRGDGRSWNDIDWTAKIAQAGWQQQKQSFTLSDLVATVTQRQHQFTLQNLTVTKGGSIAASGQANLDDQSWALNVVGQNFSAGPVSDQPVELELHADGKGPSATLHELSVRSGDIEVHANGSYDSRVPKPISLNVALAHLPTFQGSSQDALIRGNVRGDVSLGGTLAQLSIVKGQLLGSDVYVQQRRIGDLAVEISGTIQPDHADIVTTEAQVLGGSWRFHAIWPDAIDEKTTGVRLLVGVRDLPLADVADLTHVKELSGKLSGAWTIDSPLSFDRNRISVLGASELRDVSLHQFHANRITAQTMLKQGRFTADPIEVEDADGHATLHADFALAQPTLWNLKADVKNWKVQQPGAPESAIVSVQTQLAADLVKQSAVGNLAAQANITLNEKTTGTANLHTIINGRTITLNDIEIDALGGKARGAGVLPLDQPMTATGHLAWSDFDAAQLVNLVPQADGLAGKIAGSAALAPADDPRALGPLKLIATAQVADGHYKTIQIGDANLTAYLNTERAVLDHSELRLAGGDVKIWARTAQHPEAGRSAQLQIDLHNLDLQQFADAIPKDNAKPDEKPMSLPGKIQGSVVLVGSIANRDHLFGQGNLAVTESDLLNFPGISNLYQIMSIGQSRLASHGNGSVQLRLENNTLHLDTLRYFNQGTEVRANAMVHDIWQLPDSPIEGAAVGSAQPLKDTKLPYLADVNRIMAALQPDLTSVMIEGTVKKPQAHPVPFGAVGEGMKAFIVGDVKGEE